MDYNDIQDLKKELWNKNIQLNLYMNGDKGIGKSLYHFAEIKAEKEKLLSKAKEQQTAKLRIENDPVSIIKEKVKGLTANEKFDYEIAKALWESHKANIDRIRTAIDTIRTLISIAKAEINLK